ncbi:MAG TPA: pyridoxal-phosphate dependent enzyme, partial [Gemmatimonadaceae bacterium]|nr:pyridoxal-phosphate dependent enzyme [Gemmatimonadaceae bacterium]
KALGAEVVLTPAAEGMKGAIARATKLQQEIPGSWIPQQFDNPANPAWHRATTGPEILQDFAGKRLDWFVTGYGTGGTLTGAGEVMKLARPDLKIAVSEPAGAALLSGNEWKPHKIQGWSPDFIPSVVNRDIYDQIVKVDEVYARDTARALAQQEGIFCGISGGATFAAALDIAITLPEGSVLLAMIPDTGERYLSTFLFEGVNEGSDDEWLATLESK